MLARPRLHRVETIGASAVLYLGDCREVLRGKLPPVDLIVTSPPYNTNAAGFSHRSTTWRKIPDSDPLRYDVGYPDAKKEADYQKEQRDIFSLCYKLVNDGGSLFYNHQIRWRDGELVHPVLWFTPEGWRMRSEIIWARGGGMVFKLKMFTRYDERILWFVKGDKYKWNQESVRFGTVWRMTPAKASQSLATYRSPPAAFPTELPRRCIMATTDPGDTVLDPYTGTGTTGAVAISLGRKFIGIERDPEFFELSLARLRKAVSEMGNRGHSGKWLRDVMAEDGAV